MASSAVKKLQWKAGGVGDQYGWSVVTEYEAEFTGNPYEWGFIDRELREKGIRYKAEEIEGGKKIIIKGGNSIEAFRKHYPHQAGTLSKKQDKPQRGL